MDGEMMAALEEEEEAEATVTDAACCFPSDFERLSDTGMPINEHDRAIIRAVITLAIVRHWLDHQKAELEKLPCWGDDKPGEDEDDAGESGAWESPA